MKKTKKIVVITGSPRKDGNSFAMTDVFIEAAEKKGHSITRFDAAYLDIRGCAACESCFKTGMACILHDDFNEIAPAIEEADVIVLTTPLYWYTFPAKLKAVIDKFFALYIGKRGIGNKECALIACCGDRIECMEGLTFAYKHTIELMEWKSIGEVLVPFVNVAGDIHKTDGIKQAEKLAEMF